MAQLKFDPSDYKKTVKSVDDEKDKLDKTSTKKNSKVKSRSSPVKWEHVPKKLGCGHPNLLSGYMTYYVEVESIKLDKGGSAAEVAYAQKHADIYGQQQCLKAIKRWVEMKCPGDCPERTDAAVVIGTRHLDTDVLEIKKSKKKGSKWRATVKYVADWKMAISCSPKEEERE